MVEDLRSANEGRLRKQDYSVRRLTPSEVPAAREMIKSQHYSGTVGSTYTRVYGLFRDGELVGVSWWLPPSKQTAMGLTSDWHNVLSLSRLVVDPSVPTNGESFLIGRSIRLIRQEQKFAALVTFADVWRGHQGTIYKATGWEYVGQTKPMPVWYNGQTTRANRNGNFAVTKEMMAETGHVLLGRFPKHKFVIRLKDAPSGQQAGTTQVSE